MLNSYQKNGIKLFFQLDLFLSGGILNLLSESCQHPLQVPPPLGKLCPPALSVYLFCGLGKGQDKRRGKEGERDKEICVALWLILSGDRCQHM